MIGFLVQTGSVLAACGTIATAYRNEGAIALNVWYTDCQGNRKQDRVEELISPHEALVGKNVVIGFSDSQGSNYIKENSTINPGYNQFGCHGVNFTNTYCERER